MEISELFVVMSDVLWNVDETVFHIADEMTTDRDMTPASDNSLAAFLSNVLPDTPPSNSNKNGDNNTAEENSFKIEVRNNCFMKKPQNLNKLLRGLFKIL